MPGSLPEDDLSGCVSRDEGEISGVVREGEKRDRNDLGLVAGQDLMDELLTRVLHIDTRQATLATEQRRGMNVVYWSSVSHGFMLIGRNPIGDLQIMAHRVEETLLG